MIALVVALVVLQVAAAWVGITRERDLRGSYASQLDTKDGLIADLVHQVQANSQGYIAPTWVDPPAPAEERHVMYDDTGLIEVEFDPDEEVAV